MDSSFWESVDVFFYISTTAMHSSCVESVECLNEEILRNNQPSTAFHLFSFKSYTQKVHICMRVFFSWLPVWSFFQVRLVCKSWLSGISNTLFIETLLVSSHTKKCLYWKGENPQHPLSWTGCRCGVYKYDTTYAREIMLQSHIRGLPCFFRLDISLLYNNLNQK